MGVVEHDIQTRIIQYLRGRKYTYVLNIGGSASTAKGTPDIIVCYRGHFCAFEVKRDSTVYSTTRPQKIRMDQIRAALGYAWEVESIADVAQSLDMLDAVDIHMVYQHFED